MPTGYIPAKKNPVPNRMDKSIHFDISSVSSSKLQEATRMAQIKNTRDGENRSAIIRIAKTKVPIINPACTEDKT